MARTKESAATVATPNYAEGGVLEDVPRKPTANADELAPVLAGDERPTRELLDALELRGSPDDLKHVLRIARNLLDELEA